MLGRVYSKLDPLQKDYISDYNKYMMKIIDNIRSDEKNSSSYTTASEWYDYIYQYYEDDYNDLINNEFAPIAFISKYIVDDYETNFGYLFEDYRDLSAEEFIKRYGASADIDYKYTDEEAKQVYQENKQKIYNLVEGTSLKRLKSFQRRRNNT